ncbi:MAG: sulfite exporter TauE/SafE family protein [Acidimicrobiia bacterium]|nr:sulfite exporter TauE/SafE family protein [Acidimicrobiia bacterium]
MVHAGVVAIQQAHHSTSASPVLLALAGFVGGFAVGLTGMGGGALMTPALVLLFNIDPKVAVASDLVNSLVMKPIGSAVHVRQGTIQWRLVALMAAGSVPAAFLGAFLLNQLGDSKDVESQVKALLGWALLVASLAIVAKAVLTAREHRRLTALGLAPNPAPHSIKPVPTVLVGVAGGFIVGMTSVGSGSLMIVLLMLLYPRLSSKSLVGTDLVQAVPLVMAAALGQLLFGRVDFAVAGALVVGSAPGVYCGARSSAYAPDGIVRPVLIAVLVGSALALLIPDNPTHLAWAFALVALTAVPLWGAVDATLRPHADWEAARHSRTRWVAVQGIGAPFLVGFLAALVYFFNVRRVVAAAGHGLAEPAAAADQPQ